MMTKADVLKQKIQQERQREQLGSSLERQKDAFQQPLLAPNSDRQPLSYDNSNNDLMAI